jgi:hypothetical protein
MNRLEEIEIIQKSLLGSLERYLYDNHSISMRIYETSIISGQLDSLEKERKKLEDKCREANEDEK